MSTRERNIALMICRQLFMTPEIQKDAAEQYEDLLRRVDKYQREGVISVGERNDLILEATRHYANAVEGLAQSGELKMQFASRPDASFVKT